MKKIWVGVILIFIGIIIFELAKTYSYYVDEYNNNVKYEVAKWKVVVNKKDITLEEDKEFIINDYVYKQSEDSNLSASNNKFAPGMIAEFTIEIDSKDVDVAFDYILDIDIASLENDNIKIAYISNSLENIILEDNLYYGSFDLDSVIKNKKDLITIGIEWEDNEDAKDFEFASNYEDKLNIPVKLSFKQKTE